MTNALLIDPIDIDYRALAKQLFLRAPQTTNFNRLRKRLRRQAGDTIARFGMAPETQGPNPKWLVCLSGGKDSHALLAVLLDLKAHGNLPVDLIACNLDQKQPGFPAETLPNYFKSIGVPFHIETQDTYSIVTEKIPEGKTFCSLCSRRCRANCSMMRGMSPCCARLAIFARLICWILISLILKILPRKVMTLICLRFKAAGEWTLALCLLFPSKRTLASVLHEAVLSRPQN